MCKSKPMYCHVLPNKCAHMTYDRRLSDHGSFSHTSKGLLVLWCGCRMGVTLRLLMAGLCSRGGRVSAMIFKYALKIQTLMSGIKDLPGFNTITSLRTLRS